MYNWIGIDSLFSITVTFLAAMFALFFPLIPTRDGIR